MHSFGDALNKKYMWFGVGRNRLHFWARNRSLLQGFFATVLVDCILPLKWWQNQKLNNCALSVGVLQLLTFPAFITHVSQHSLIHFLNLTSSPLFSSTHSDFQPPHFCHYSPTEFISHSELHSLLPFI